MLTKSEFTELMKDRIANSDKINEAYAAATPDEQREYLIWLDEVNPAETPDEDNPLASEEEILQVPEDDIELVDRIQDAVAQLLHPQELEGPNPQQVAAHKRAQRSNMLRSIRAKYRLMQPFTVTECANRIGRDPQEVAAYLVAEIRRGTGVFHYDADTRKFYLDNPFI